MKAKQASWALALVLGSTALLQAAPQYDSRRDADTRQENRRDQDRDRDQYRGNESAYYNNKYYQQGWKDGLKHKHKNKKWKNTADRQAYEAGYMHGDRGEQWQKPNRHRDRDNDHDRH